MNKYTIYLTILGKKIKTVAKGNTQEEAKQTVLRNITWDKIVKHPNPIMEAFGDIFKGFKS